MYGTLYCIRLLHGRSNWTVQFNRQMTKRTVRVVIRLCVCVSHAVAVNLGASLSSAQYGYSVLEINPLRSHCLRGTTRYKNAHRPDIYTSSGMRTRSLSVGRYYVFSTPLTLVRCTMSGGKA
jgi:hypothetical protein